jgi:hypothetical protein
MGMQGISAYLSIRGEIWLMFGFGGHFLLVYALLLSSLGTPVCLCLDVAGKSG